jgi:hypothetical protein
MVGYRDELYVFGGEVGFSNGVETPLWIYDIKVGYVLGSYSYFHLLSSLFHFIQLSFPPFHVEQRLAQVHLSQGRRNSQGSPLAHGHRLPGLDVHLRRISGSQGIDVGALGLSFRYIR